MKDLQKYLKEKLAELEKSYDLIHALKIESDSNNDLRRRWERDYERTQAEWQSVKSISDVLGYVNRFEATVKQYQNVKAIFSDAYDMDLALYKAESAIQKMAQCFDVDRMDFHTFSQKDIDDMFNKLYNNIEAMQNVNERRALRD